MSIDSRLRSRWDWMLLFPIAAIVGAVSLIPFFKALVDSLYFDRFGQRRFVGGAQFAYLFSDPGLFVSLAVTFVWATVSSAGVVVFGFAIAGRMVVHRRLQPWVYAILLVPWGLPVFVTAPLWRIVTSAGLPLRLDLYGAPLQTFFASMAANLWASTPMAGMALYVAMKKVPVSLTEAARLDGAGSAELMRYVYRPGARNTALAVGLLAFLHGCKEFSLVYLLSGGGPPIAVGLGGRSIIGSTTTLGIYMYEVFTESGDLGLSSAYAVTMSVLMLVLVFVWYFRFARRGFGSQSWRQRVKPSTWGLPMALVSAFITAGFCLVTIWAVLVLVRISLSVKTFLPPAGLTAGNFAAAFADANVLRSFLNTVVIATSACVLTGFVAFCAAYFARLHNPRVGIILIGALQILSAATGIYSLIPLYSMMRSLGLVDTYLPVVLSAVNQSLPLSCILLLAYLKRIPESLFDEARIAGAGAWQMAGRVVMPLALPAILLVLVLSTVTAWNGFTPALILLHSEAKFPISLRLFSLAGELGSSGNNWGVFGAVSLMNVAILAALLAIYRNRLTTSGLSDLQS